MLLRLTHGLAILACLMTPLPLSAQAFGAVGILFSLHRQGRQPARVRGLTLTAEAEWEIVLPGRTLMAQLEPGTVVTPWLVILHLRSTDRCRLAVPIWRDAVDPESFRRLRVHLKVRGYQSTGTAGD